MALVGALNGGGSFRWQEDGARLDPASFEAVTRGIDRGLPPDAERIRDRMELAPPMARSPCRWSKANCRQQRPSPPDQSGRARGRVGVPDRQHRSREFNDARLLLTGPELAGAGGALAELDRAQGLIDAPGALSMPPASSWVFCARAVEQAKRVDVLRPAAGPAHHADCTGSVRAPGDRIAGGTAVNLRPAIGLAWCARFAGGAATRDCAVAGNDRIGAARHPPDPALAARRAYQHVRSVIVLDQSGRGAGCCAGCRQIARRRMGVLFPDRLVAIVIEHEQADRRRQVAVAAIYRSRRPVRTRSSPAACDLLQSVQNASSRLTLAL